MKFTDALDEYLETKKVRDEVRASYEGYDFFYHFYKECSRLDAAKDALNSFFETKEKQ